MEDDRRRERRQELTIGWCLGISVGALGIIFVNSGSWLALLGTGVCFLVLMRRLRSTEQS